MREERSRVGATGESAVMLSVFNCLPNRSFVSHTTYLSFSFSNKPVLTILFINLSSVCYFSRLCIASVHYWFHVTPRLGESGGK